MFDENKYSATYFLGIPSESVDGYLAIKRGSNFSSGKNLSHLRKFSKFNEKFETCLMKNDQIIKI